MIEPSKGSTGRPEKSLARAGQSPARPPVSLKEAGAMSQARTTVPILMYHKVGAAVDHPEDTFLNVSGDAFERQMRALAHMRYRAMTFAQIVEVLRSGQPLPRRVFAITFDDGYECVGDVAAPILERYGFPATVFVVSKAAGGANTWDGITGRPLLPLMAWDHLRELGRVGWEMAGHTTTHPHLNELDDLEALQEIKEGKAAVEAQLDTSLQTFCYPFGHFNARTPALVQEAGFVGACTTRSGLAKRDTDPFLLPRVKIAYRDGVAGMLYRLMVRPRLPNLRRNRSPRAV
ncbi:MAG: polysaccharide deacetylase [Chthonomonadaceae bacterium]|nr:polysaccharide deacetylase [Chthonomonadaceae bacterium]